VDAASRGYRVLLLEQDDFGKGTSSRSTKLVHGGVRYLEQGNISLVMEALKERGSCATERAASRQRPRVRGAELRVVGSAVLRHRPQASTTCWPALRVRPLAVRSRARRRSQRPPDIEPAGLRGGVLYYDGQFDDARLLINAGRAPRGRRARRC
jgi:glycerol-3-phosphate dehydrogenase